jgi:hypothetical protein
MKASGWLRALWVLAPCCYVFGCERPDWDTSPDVPVATAGTPSVGAAGTGGQPCRIDSTVGTSPIFAKHTLLSSAPARSELYAYVSDAEAAELRTSRRLLPKPDTSGTGTNPAVQVRLSQVQIGASPNEASLIAAMVQRFKNVRTTWPNAFALRLLEHPGTEHMNPVRIVLRPEAWIGRLSDNHFTVADLKNQLVTTEQAQASPERIAAIYVLMSPSVSGGVACDRGFRELSLGNEGMVESWSLGSQEIATQLDSEIASLTNLFDVSRACGSVDRGNGMTFQGFTVCTTWATFGAVTEYSSYGWSLAKPTELYKPSAQNLVSLIDALDGDRFEIDPFVVEPEPPSAGEGGAAGAGGESGGGAGGAP